MKQPAVYILANKPYGTLYVGVTAHLIQRVYQHKADLMDGFSKKYQCHLLVHYEFFADMLTAIRREKQLKGGPRERKIALIRQHNPAWNDLYRELL